MKVCSAHAEVIPYSEAYSEVCLRLLRTRGGDPAEASELSEKTKSAPHTRR